jgi:hypothetical protein
MRRYFAASVLAAFALVAAWATTSVWRRFTPAASASRPQATAANPFLPAKAADPGWPFLRGPNYDGHSPETKLADAWPESGPPVLWSRALGQGYSGFVAADGRLY